MMSAEPEAQSAAPQLQDANLFTITGPILINYSRSSIAGVPTLSYRDAELDLSFTGDEITQVDSPLGELVTVTIQDVVDAFVRRFTLLAPTVRLGMGEELSFDTLGLETTDHSFAFTLPPGPRGVLQVNRAHQLQGVAQAVVF